MDIAQEQVSAARRITAHAFTYLPATLLPGILAVGAVYFFTRAFTTQEYGVYALILAVTTPLTILVTEWAAQPIGRFYSEYVHRGLLVPFLTSVEQIYIRIVGVVTLLSLIFFVINLQIHALSLLSLVGVYVSLVTQCFSAIALPVLMASLRPALYRRAVVGASTISTVSSILLVYLTGAHIACLLWGPAVANLLLLPWIARQTGVQLVRRPRRLQPGELEVLRRLFRYGLPMTVWFFSASLLYSEDRYMIGVFRGPSEVAVYGVNFNLVAMASGLLNGPVALATGPVLYQQWSAGRMAESSRTLSIMTEIYGILAALMIGGTMVIGPDLVHVLFDRSYWAGAMVLVPVMIGRLFWGASLIGHKTLELTERTLTMSASALVAASLNLILNLLLVPRFGFVGSSFATLVSYGAYSVIIWFQSRRELQWSVRAPRIAVYLGVSVVLAVAIRYGLSATGIFTMGDRPLVHLLVGAAAYLLIVPSVFFLAFGRRIRTLMSGA